MSKVSAFPTALGNQAPPRADFSVSIAAHERSYDFSYLLPLYGEVMVGEVCRFWPRVCLLQKREISGARYLALKMLFVASQAVALTDPKSEIAHFVRWLQVRTLRSVPGNLLQAAVDVIGRKLRDPQDFTLTRSRLKRRRANVIYNLNGLLRILADLDELPPVSGLKVRRQADDTDSRRPSLGELGLSGKVAVPCYSGSLDDHVEAMLSLCESRLRTLRDCLEADFAAEWNAFEQGQTWLMDGNLPSNDEVREAAKGLWRSYRKSDFTAKLQRRLESLGVKPADYVAVAVRWVHGVLGGVFYAKSATKLTIALLRLAGGAERVVRHLEANEVATNAVFGLILCDSGMNIAPTSKLPAQPFISDAKRGHRRIATLAAHKLRAEGKIVQAAFLDDWEADIPLKSQNQGITSILAIERYQKMVAPLRRRAEAQGSEDANLLFLSAGGRSINAGAILNRVGDGFCGYVWPDFLKRHKGNEIIGGLPITRSMIRTTVVLLRSGRSEFSVAPAQALAEHAKAGTTTTYLNAAFMRKQLDEQIRFYLDLFEAALVFDIYEGHKLIRLDEHTLLDRVLTAVDHGLDFACADRVPAEAKPVTRPTCTPLNPCVKCPVRRFVPSETSMLTLYLAHTALQKAELDFIGTNPSRWARFWLPWRALTEAYVLKLKASQYSLEYRRVTEMAHLLLSDGRLCLPIVR